MPIALGLEMSLGCSFLGSIIWATITLLLVLHRRSIKIRSKKDIAESIEDARIWTSDMSPAPVNNHYEKISMKNINPQYDTIKDMQINNQVTRIGSRIRILYRLQIFFEIVCKKVIINWVSITELPSSPQ